VRITVTTPTGNVGRHVVEMLVRAGVRPTVLVRDPARMDPAVLERVDAVPVDQRDADAVADRDEETHRHSVERIFPRLGETGTTAEVLALVR